MGELSEAEAAIKAEREFEDDEASADEEKVINAASTASRAEKTAIKELLAQVDSVLNDSAYEPSKWQRLIQDCLAEHGIEPNGTEQAVIFTEYADSAEWLTRRLQGAGFSARMYSGRQAHVERDMVRAAFMRSEFQIIVTTDAGNEAPVPLSPVLAVIATPGWS